jgi:hypothetical protein
METQTATITGRALNMQEKRKLEKLLLTDIDAAIASYDAQRAQLRNPLRDTVLRRPPAKATQLLTRYVATKLRLPLIEKQLNALGFDIYGYSDKPYLTISSSNPPSAIAQFDEETRKAKSALTEMKRTYTLKLFAGDAQAQELFAALTKELKAIIG